MDSPFPPSEERAYPSKGLFSAPHRRNIELEAYRFGHAVAPDWAYRLKLPQRGNHVFPEFRTVAGPHRVAFGEWLVLNDDGNLVIMDDSMFRALFVPV